MKTIKKSIFLILSLLAVCAVSFVPNKSYAATVWADCQPARIILYEDKASTICTGGTTWFIVTFAQHSTAFANRYIAVLTSAIAANKPVMILYDNAQGSTGAREVLVLDMLK